MNGFCIHANETTILEKTQATRLHDHDRVNKPYFFYSFLCFQKQEFEFVKYHIYWVKKVPDMFQHSEWYTVLCFYSLLTVLDVVYTNT